MPISADRPHVCLLVRSSTLLIGKLFLFENVFTIVLLLTAAVGILCMRIIIIQRKLLVFFVLCFDRVGFTLDGRAFGTFCDPSEVLVAIIWNNAKWIKQFKWNTSFRYSSRICHSITTIQMSRYWIAPNGLHSFDSFVLCVRLRVSIHASRRLVRRKLDLAHISCRFLTLYLTSL